MRRAPARAQPAGQKAAAGKDEVGDRTDLPHEFGAKVEAQDVEVEDDRIDAAVDGKTEQGGVGQEQADVAV